MEVATVARRGSWRHAGCAGPRRCDAEVLINRPVGPRSGCSRIALLTPCSSSSSSSSSSRSSVAFPQNYTQLHSSCKDAVGQALLDGVKLVEVDFPPAGLETVPGDEEGANEMDANLAHVLAITALFAEREELVKSTVRVLLPDEKEMASAAEMQSNAGGRLNANLRLDFLTRPSFLSDFGIDVDPFQRGDPPVARLAQDARAGAVDVFVAAYPSFNVNEMLSLQALWRDLGEEAPEAQKPIVVMNGEMERLRGGYYPEIFYPKVAAMSRDFVPGFEGVFCVRNFKSFSKPGVLYRKYP